MRLNGLIAAPFTAMKNDYSINLDEISKYAQLLIENNVSGVFICGTSGESMSLTTSERKQIVEEWIKYATPDFKIIVHIGSTCIESSKALMVHAEKIGASAVGMIGPCFFKPSSVDVLVDYCQTVAAASPKLPFYYYHMPSMNGINYSMRTFLEKGADKIPNLTGIKYTYEDLMDFHLCQKFDNGRFDMLFGRDELLLCGLTLGAKGAVGSTYNFMAPLYNDIIEKFNAGDIKAARALQGKSMEIIRLIVSSGNSFMSNCKHIMRRFGLELGTVRKPLVCTTNQQAEELNKKLDELGFAEVCNCNNITV
jgi:N-acetylneuraminate lyase